MRVRFGRVELDAESRQVWRAGQPVHLSPKAFDLLLLLIDHRPAAVPKSEIRSHLWPDTFVSDTNLPTLVAEIRAAIGDDARKPAFVRTVHGYGYSFDADVSEANRPDAAGPLAWLVGPSVRIELVSRETVLGREGAGVLVIESPTISRRHARLRISNGQATIEDLGSKNGTYVNDDRVTASMQIDDGDALRVGSLVFTFRLARSGASTQTI